MAGEDRNFRRHVVQPLGKSSTGPPWPVRIATMTAHAWSISQSRPAPAPVAGEDRNWRMPRPKRAAVRCQHRPPVAGEDRNLPDGVAPHLLEAEPAPPPVAGEDRNHVQAEDHRQVYTSTSPSRPVKIAMPSDQSDLSYQAESGVIRDKG